MSVDTSELKAALHDFCLEAVNQAAQIMVAKKREDAAWSTRVTDGIEIAGIVDGETTFVVEITEDDEIGLGEIYENGPIPGRIITPNKPAYALFWDGLDHPVAKADWPGTDKHAQWWSENMEEEWIESLDEALG